jgi:hypothetical protein
MALGEPIFIPYRGPLWARRQRSSLNVDGLAALPTIKPPSPLLLQLQIIFLSSVTRGFLDRSSSPTILARPQLPPFLML